MLLKLIRSLEDPLHPLLGPNLRGLSLMGLWQPERKPSNYVYNVVSVLCFLFVVTQYIQLYFVRGDLSLMMDNLSVTTISTMAIIKVSTFHIWHHHWMDFIRSISAMEISQKENHGHEDEKIKISYYLHARIVTYFFWILCSLTITMVMVNPVVLYASSSEPGNGTVHYPPIFSSWLPFDVSQPPKYFFNIILHIVMGYYGVGSFAVWDTIVVSSMVFFGGQLQLLKNSCVRIAGAQDELFVDDEEVHRRIVRCHLHHVFLLKYSKIFNNLISPVMFVYFIICSIMLSAIALQITTRGIWRPPGDTQKLTTPINTCTYMVVLSAMPAVQEVRSTLQMFWTVEFLAATLIQLFMFYWHSNQVLFQSMAVERGAYETAWCARDKRLTRELALLAMGLRLPIVFSAGPFNKMTVATFTAILRAAYSYFTLLRARQQE